MRLHQTLLLTGTIALSPSLAMAQVSPTPIITGHLQMVWGDRAPHTKGPASKFRTSLVTGNGKSLRLDPDSARRAAGDLYALYGEEVALSIARQASLLHTDPVLIPEAIVALTPSQMTHTTRDVTGPQPWITLMCKFAGNADEPKPLSYFQSLYGNQPGEMGHFWSKVSYGKVTINGSTAAGWYTLPHARSHYITMQNGEPDADLTALFQDCTAAADADIDFSQFVGIGLAFNDDLDGYAWGGSRYAALDGPAKTWYVTWRPPWGFNNLAPNAHEMGHGFGLPHANNSDGDPDPYDNPWDVMSDSWYNATHSATYGTLPKEISIWSRAHLGWVDANERLEINANGNWQQIHLSFAELQNINGMREIRIQPPGFPNSEYFTVEARQSTGTYDGNLAGTAVIIHHVQTGREEPAWSVDAAQPPADRANNPGSIFKVGESIALTPSVHLQVAGTANDGFLVSIQVGGDVLFQNGFEP